MRVCVQTIQTGVVSRRDMRLRQHQTSVTLETANAGAI